MKPTRTPLKVQQRHAQRLKDGMAAVLTDDDGATHNVTIDNEPWLLGGHTYVVNSYEGNVLHMGRRYRAYSVMRVQPKGSK